MGAVRGSGERQINPDTQVAELDSQVQIKYLFESKTCAGGSPRIQLLIDRDGDEGPAPPANAFGYLGNGPRAARAALSAERRAARGVAVPSGPWPRSPRTPRSA